MVCYAMESLLLGGLVKEDTEVSLEVELGQREYTGPIEQHPLVMYWAKYGFEIIQNEDTHWMPLMKTTVKTIVSYCNKKEIKRKIETEPSAKRSKLSFGTVAMGVDKDILFLKTL